MVRWCHLPAPTGLATPVCPGPDGLVPGRLLARTVPDPASWSLKGRSGQLRAEQRPRQVPADGRTRRRIHG